MMKLFILFLLSKAALASNLPRFNYGTTVNRSDGGTDYGVADWESVICPDLSNCAGYPDTWWYVNATEWSLPTTESDCRWCPADGPGCNFAHHQSPIPLTREVADQTSSLYDNCTDDHWMEYRDSSCTWDDLKSKNSFTIERHALKVSMPIRAKNASEGTGYRPDCQGGDWGRIDFSNGFKNWLLSHTDIHMPSEHTQNGKRYDAELQMHHLYSQSEYQMSTVAVFLQAYEDVDDNPYLNKLICQWRMVEDTTRQQCGFPSVTEDYPGCWTFRRNRNRKLRAKQPPQTLYNLMSTASNMSANIGFDEDEDKRPPFDVKAYLKMEKEMQGKPRRHLFDYDEIPWFNYWPMLSVRTEYYHSYVGTDTVPPCYGSISESTQNFWHIMKDPIRISNIQLDEMNRLLVNRIAPPDDLVNPCKPDTAGVVDSNGWINTARPPQEINPSHENKFCECTKWHSRWPEDLAWCDAYTFDQRLTTNPYNFQSSGF